jgi:ABC-type branched-subunit amino acid transport system substrate-binding protein
MKRLGPHVRLLALLCALALVGAACGRDEGGETGAGGDDKKTETGKLAAAPGFDPAGGTIKLGTVSALTGPVAIIGVPLTEGNKIFFEALNAKGGIAGKYKVELVIEDSQYDAPTAVQKYQKIKNDVTMFAQLIGTPTVNALLPQLRTDKIVAAPASLDAEWMAEENLVPVGGPYQIEFINGAHWYLNEGGGEGKAICMMAVESPYGDAGVEGLQAAAQSEGFEIKATSRFKPTDQDFTAPVTQLKNAGCQAVFLTALPSNTGPILGTGAKLGFNPQWMGQLPVFVTALAKSPQLLPILEKSFLLVGEGPQWGDENTPGMKQMLADIAQFRPNQEPDFYVMLGYVQAKTVTALLEKAVERGDLSREGILAALNGLGAVDVGGLLGDWTYGPPAERQPSRVTTIFKINPAVPGALEAVKVNFTTEPAKAFRFKKT